jgi:Bacterial conjugation TrbI-like protein
MSDDEINNLDSSTKGSTVNSLLFIEDDETSVVEDSISEDNDDIETEQEDPALVQTKHSIINSPLSRFGVVGGGIGVVVLFLFMFLNPIMNGDKAKKKEEVKVAQTPSVEEQKEVKQDGDIYAKLALQRQAEQLSKLGVKEEKTNIVKPDNKETIKPNTKEKSLNTPKPVVRQQTSFPQFQRRIERPTKEPQVVQRTPEPVKTSTPAPQIQAIRRPSPQPKNEIASKPNDPLAELEKLRTLGSAGQVYYTASADTENSNDAEDADYTPRRRSNSSNSETRTEVINNTSQNADSTDNTEIERLSPRWAPVAVQDEESEESELTSIKRNQDYSPLEAGIIEGREEQYLVVGEYAAATLDTPLIWAPDAKSKSQTKFVARLTKPLMSNTGEEAIPADTLLSIEMQEVDSSGRATAVVTAILKDGTEYPVPRGAITVLGDKAKPLIASQYHNKGREIMSMDAGLGLISGLAKAGEIINQPEVESSISQSNGGFNSIQTSRSRNRSLLGAFVQGAFGTISEQVKQRNQKAIDEIMRRPNIWFVPQNTKITIQVNRSLQI